jgi:hypothetical protein
MAQHPDPRHQEKEGNRQATPIIVEIKPAG